MLTESSEIFGIIFYFVLWSISDLRFDIMPFRMSSTNCRCCAFCIWLWEYIFTCYTWNMTGVSWYMLFANLMCRTSYPVPSILAPVTEDILIRFVWWRIRRIMLSVKSMCICASHWSWVTDMTTIHDDLSIDVTCCHSEHIVFGWYMTSITR